MDRPTVRMNWHEQYAKTNGNVIVLQQEHRFAGVARNTGMGHARGEYLIFLDSDDYFEENLLHDALARIEETNADICAFGAKSLNNQTGIVTTLRHTCMIDLCPSSGVFNRTTNPVICFASPRPHPGQNCSENRSSNKRSPVSKHAKRQRLLLRPSHGCPLPSG